MPCKIEYCGVNFNINKSFKNPEKMIKAEEELRELIREIRHCFKCWNRFIDWDKESRMFIRDLYNEGPWFFPPYGNVKGFFGTGRVVFICKMPSTSGRIFPDEKIPGDENKLFKVKLFYDSLNRLKTAHITDLVKCRRSTKLPSDEWERMLNNCFCFLVKELAILMLDDLKPILLVAVGHDAYDALRRKEVKLKEGITNELMKRLVSSDRGRLRNVVNERVQIYSKHITHYAAWKRREELKKKLIQEIRDVEEDAEQRNLI